MRHLAAVLTFCLTVSCSALPPTNSVFFTEGRPVHWVASDFPLNVVVDRRMTPQQQTATQSTVLWWNNQVGFTVFEITREVDIFSTELVRREPRTVYVMIDDLEDLELPLRRQGLAILDYAGTHMDNVLIVLDVEVLAHEQGIVLRHEFGHALSLAHDTWQRSIMYRQAVRSGGQLMPDDLAYVYWQMELGE